MVRRGKWRGGGNGEEGEMVRRGCFRHPFWCFSFSRRKQQAVNVKVDPRFVKDRRAMKVRSGKWRWLLSASVSVG